MKKRRAFWQRAAAWILSLAMIFTLNDWGLGTVSASAEEAAVSPAIKLGKAQWTDETAKADYKFPNVTATFTGDAQKIFCISVDNGGTFTVPAVPADWTEGSGSASGTVLEKNEEGKYTGHDKYVNAVSDGTELDSLTVIGNMKNDEITAFIKGITFHRNDAANTETVQEVSVAANTVDLEKGDTFKMTALAINGELHYYRYVQAPYTWYQAYDAAKGSTFQGMKGYLATITSAREQEFLYSELDLTPGSNSDGLEAWIGGARTVIDGLHLDADTSGVTANYDDSTKSDALGYLRSKDSEGNDVKDWYWVDGPEAGEPIGSGMASWEWKDAPGGYSKWNTQNSQEPNNQVGYYLDTADSADPVPSQQSAEYALEYGYDGAPEGAWNDYNPYNPGPTKGDGQKKGYGIKGYLVEYSPYGNQKPTTPTATDTKTIPNDVDGEVPEVKKIDGAKLSGSSVNVGEEISVTDWHGSDMPVSEYTKATDDNASYQWYKLNDDKTKFEPVEGANNLLFTPDTAGKYIVAVSGQGEYTGTVYVGANGTVVKEDPDSANPSEDPIPAGTDGDGVDPDKGIPAVKEPVITDAKLSATSVEVGTEIKVTQWKGSDKEEYTEATDGNASYQWYKLSDDKTKFEKVSGANTMTFKPDKAGKYIVAVSGQNPYSGTVYVGADGKKVKEDPTSDKPEDVIPAGKDEGNVDPDDGILVTDKPVITDAKLSATSVEVGKEIKVTQWKGSDKEEYTDANATNASYQWYKLSDDKTKFEKVSGANTLTFKPDKAGKYIVAVSGQNPYSGTVYVGADGKKVKEDPTSDKPDDVIPAGKDEGNVDPDGAIDVTELIPLKGAKLDSERPVVGKPLNVTEVSAEGVANVLPEDISHLDFEWQYKDKDGKWVVIPDSDNSPQYIPRTDDAGKDVRCKITPKKDDTKYSGEVYAYSDGDPADNPGNKDEGYTENPTSDSGVGPVKPVEEKSVLTYTKLDNNKPVVGVPVSVTTVNIASCDADGNTRAGVDNKPDKNKESFQWESSVDGTTWTPIEGATDISYTPVAGDVGKLLRCKVTGKEDQKITGTVYAYTSDVDEAKKNDTTKGTDPVEKRKIDSADLDNEYPSAGETVKVENVKDPQGNKIPTDDVNITWQTKDSEGNWKDTGKTGDTYTVQPGDTNIRAHVTPKDESKYTGEAYAFSDADPSNDKDNGNPSKENGASVKPAPEPAPSPGVIDSAELDNEYPSAGETVKVENVKDPQGKEIPTDDVNITWQTRGSDGSWKDTGKTGDTYTVQPGDTNIRAHVTPKDESKYTGEAYAFSDADPSNDKDNGNPSKENGASVKPAPEPAPSPRVIDSAVLDNDNPKPGDTVKVTDVKDKDGTSVDLDQVDIKWQTKDSDGNWKDTGKTGDTYTVQPGDTNIRAHVSPKSNSGLSGSADAVSDGNPANGTPTVDGGAPVQPAATTQAPATTEAPAATEAPVAEQTADGIELDVPTITMSKKVGKGKKFRLKLLKTKGAKIQAASNNKKIATISKKGVIKGKKLGKTTVIINIVKGKYKVQYKVKVKVVKKLNNLNLKKYKTSYKHPAIALYKKIYVGGTYKVKWKHIKHAKITYKIVKGRKYVKVNKKGKCTGLKPGIAKLEITAKKSDGSISKYYVLFRSVKRGGKEKKYSFLRYN